jgi:aminoglycoside phosphotransferase (APT) family kinase protein
MSDEEEIIIDVSLVKRLIATQFPEWKNLEVKPVEKSRWDNRTFHLGDNMSVRLPSAEWYAEQVDKEQFWLPKLASHLPLPISIPLAMGKPGEGYPFNWSVYKWLTGETASIERITDMNEFAKDLGEFLVALHKIDTTGGPVAGEHNFYRGDSLATYDDETRQAINLLKSKIDVELVTEIWNKAIATTWQKPPVWVHGDIAVGNLLMNNGKLSAVIDFGCLGVGDPACDLVIAWTFFKGEARDTFKAILSLDNDTWLRAMGWALWKALIVCAEICGGDPKEKENSWKIINEIVADYKVK